VKEWSTASWSVVEVVRRVLVMRMGWPQGQRSDDVTPLIFFHSCRCGPQGVCHGSAGTPLRTHANGEAQGLEAARAAIRT
jgi:hypothetical protein